MARAVQEAAILEANKALIRRHQDAFNSGDIDGAIEVFADDARNHGHRVGREGMRRVLKDIQATFPDVKLVATDLVAEGDWVVLRGILSGTHRGVAQIPHHGGLLVGVAPTGKRFEVAHIHIFRLVKGKITDHHATRDDIGMMQQLGLLPPPAPPRI